MHCFMYFVLFQKCDHPIYRKNNSVPVSKNAVPEVSGGSCLMSTWIDHNHSLRSYQVPEFISAAFVGHDSSGQVADRRLDGD